MRFAIWTFVIGCAIAVVAMFMPLLQVNGSDLVVGKRAGVSLYKAARDHELGARFMIVYKASHAREAGPKVIAALTPHVGGKLLSVLGDAHDAMDTLDGITPAQAKTLGTVLAVVVYAFLALEILAIGLLFGPALGDSALRGSRGGPAIGLALVLGAVGLVIHFAAREVAFQANDYAGAPLVELAIGAYLLPIGVVMAAGAALALLVLLLKRRHDTRVTDPKSRPNATPAST